MDNLANPNVLSSNHYKSSLSKTNSETRQLIELGVDKLNQLLAAVQTVEKSGSLERMLRQTVEEVLGLLAAEAAAIGMIEAGRGWLRLMATEPQGESLEGRHLSFNHTHDPLAVALRKEQPTIWGEVEAEELPEIYQQSPLATGVALPLHHQGHLVGVLAVFRARSDEMFRPDEIRLLELWAGLIGPVVGATHKISELETAIKSRDEFLSIASHDLRNPLTALRGFSQLTVRGIDRVPEDQPLQRKNILANLQRIIKQSNSLDKLIGKLLDVSRINTGRLELQTERLDLSEIVREASQRCFMAVTTTETEDEVEPERRHKLVVNINDQPLYGQFDRERIEQVVTNLIDNAVKYSPEGGKVTVSLHRLNEDSAELRVTDQGIGIPEEKQTVIFSRWSRVHSSREGEFSDVGGLGLGLFICRSIVRRHGGQIGLESEPGQGTIFIITLPLKEG